MVFFRKIVKTIILLLLFNIIYSYDFTPVRIKYSGGDWYNDEECLTILAKYVNTHTPIEMNEKQIVLTMDDKRIFEYPFLFITGHEDIKYTVNEIENLRKYLLSGGFLFIDDDYGFNKSIRKFISVLFPERKLIRLPQNNEIMNTFFYIKKIPKIHEHYPGPPELYAVYVNNKIVLLYAFNTNISDGWQNYEKYKDPDYKREQAKKMGVNIIYYALFK